MGMNVYIQIEFVRDGRGQPFQMDGILKWTEWIKRSLKNALDFCQTRCRNVCWK